MQIRYALDGEKLLKAAKRQGFQTLSHFATKHGLNRATLNNYIQGRGPLPDPLYTVAESLDVDPLTLLRPVPLQKSLPYVEEIVPVIHALTHDHQTLAIGVLGSRARGEAAQYADWDLGVTGGINGVTSSLSLRLKGKLDTLIEDLPRMVDFINLDEAPVWFLANIDYTPIFLAGNQQSWAYWMGVLHGIRKDQTAREGTHTTRGGA